MVLRKTDSGYAWFIKGKQFGKTYKTKAKARIEKKLYDKRTS